MVMFARALGGVCLLSTRCGALLTRTLSPRLLDAVDLAQRPFDTAQHAPVGLVADIGCDHGFVAAELRCGGAPCLGGYTIERASRIKGNFISRPAGWGDPGLPGDFRLDLKPLEGEHVAVHLVLPDAELYSVAFVCASGGESGTTTLESDDGVQPPGVRYTS